MLDLYNHVATGARTPEDLLELVQNANPDQITDIDAHSMTIGSLHVGKTLRTVALGGGMLLELHRTVRHASYSSGRFGIIPGACTIVDTQALLDDIIAGTRSKLSSGSSEALFNALSARIQEHRAAKQRELEVHLVELALGNYETANWKSNLHGDWSASYHSADGAVTFDVTEIRHNFFGCRWTTYGITGSYRDHLTEVSTTLVGERAEQLFRAVASTSCDDVACGETMAAARLPTV